MSCCRRRDRSSTSAKCGGGGTFISVNIFSHPARCLGDVAAFFIPAPQLLFRPTVSSAREEQRHLSFLPIGTRPFPKSSRGRKKKKKRKKMLLGFLSSEECNIHHDRSATADIQRDIGGTGPDVDMSNAIRALQSLFRLFPISFFLSLLRVLVSPPSPRTVAFFFFSLFPIKIRIPSNSCSVSLFFSFPHPIGWFVYRTGPTVSTRDKTASDRVT